MALEINKDLYISDSDMQLKEIPNKLTASGWVSLGNTVYYKQYGNVVTVKGLSMNDVPLNKNDYKTVATLPVGARPSMTLAFPWSRVGQGEVGIVRIHNTGVVEIYTTDGPSYWAFTITYIV